MYQAWREAFTDSNIVQVLHQITALSSFLDDAYYRNNEKPAALTTETPLDDLLIRPNPALPSQVLQAVRQSIEYWQRTVLWLGMSGGPDGTTGQSANKDHLELSDWQKLRRALIEQSGIWFNLLTGQQDLRGFTIESITHQVLDETLDDFRELAQRDLPAAAQQVATQVGDIIEGATKSVVEISNVATQAAKNGLKQIIDNINPLWRFLIVISVVAFVGLIAYMVVTGKTDEWIAAIVSAITAVSSYLGMKRGDDARVASESSITQNMDSEAKKHTDAIQQKKEGVRSTLQDSESGLGGLAGGALGQAGTFLVTAYERGLSRIQIELQSLNYSVAVTHPLIEYFIQHYQHIGLKEDFDFLTKVIWSHASREQQLRRVVTAAFGPISILLKSPRAEEPNRN